MPPGRAILTHVPNQPPADLVRFATAIHAALESRRLGTVIAIWRDASVTEHGLGFHGRRTATSKLEEPLVTFIAGGGLTRDQVLQRLQEKLDGQSSRAG